MNKVVGDEQLELVCLCRTYLELTISAQRHLEADDLSACETALQNRREVADRMDRIGLSDLNDNQQQLVYDLLGRASSAQQRLQALMHNRRAQLIGKMQSLQRAKDLADSYHPQPESTRSAAFDRIG